MGEYIKKEIELIGQFFKLQGWYWGEVGKRFLGWTEVIKGVVAKLMYRQRGRFSQSFINASMAVIFFTVITFSGKLEELISKRNSQESSGSNYLTANAQGVSGANTVISNSSKGEITEYRVVDGDTVSSIAQKFGVSIDTILWENNLKSVDAIKPKQILRILPETGVDHNVTRLIHRILSITLSILLRMMRLLLWRQDKKCLCQTELSRKKQSWTLNFMLQSQWHQFQEWWVRATSCGQLME